MVTKKIRKFLLYLIIILVFISTGSLYRQIANAADPTVYWPFDSSLTDHFYFHDDYSPDSSDGTGNDLDLDVRLFDSTITSSDCYSGNCLEFSTTEDLEVPWSGYGGNDDEYKLMSFGRGYHRPCSNPDITEDQEFTITAWVNMADATNFGIARRRTASIFEYMFWVDSDDKLKFRANDNMQASNLNCHIGRRTVNTLTAYENTWTHLAVTYDASRSSSNIKLYINGSEVNSETTVGTSNSYDQDFSGCEDLCHGGSNEGGACTGDGDCPGGSCLAEYLAAGSCTINEMQIGLSRFSSNYYADGKIDELKLFHAELSASEVETEYLGSLENLNTYFLNSNNNNITSTGQSVYNVKLTFEPVNTLDANDGIKINFQSGYDLTSVVPADISVSSANGSITTGTIPAITDQNIYIPISASDASGLITVEIEDNLVTPSIPGEYDITITTWDLDSYPSFNEANDTREHYTASEAVFGNYDVEITATVDPTLSMSLSSSTCNLNTFSTTNIRTCSYDVTVTTNATGGYSAYIREDDDLKNSASDMITDTASSYITSGGSGTDEEYGIGVDTQDTADIFPDYSGVDSCANLDNQSSTDLPAEPITGNDQRFATYTDPADGGSNRGQTTICHGAAIIGTTPAGVYSHNVIITITGNF